MSDYEVLIGDCIEQMKTLSNQSVNCCVTSPPYFGLRDYGNNGQIGLEPTPDQFVAKLVEVFREVHRVLRDDGTVWLNLGDSYANKGCNSQSVGGFTGERIRAGKKGIMDSRPREIPPGLKAKDLIGIPWRVAFALQQDGWYLRQDIIWHKPNPMPESVKDRCTKAHEYIFLLSKSPRYYFDHEAIKEQSKGVWNSAKGFNENGQRKRQGVANQTYGKDQNQTGRNKRSVWTVTTKPYKGAHFATFPPDLIEPCIVAGCPEGGTVIDPFGGSGTTAGVAVKNDRNAILCELNAEYAELIPDRVQSIVGIQNLDLFND